MKLKVWMGIALVASLLVAATSSMLVAENDTVGPLKAPQTVAVMDPVDPLIIPHNG